MWGGFFFLGLVLLFVQNWGQGTGEGAYNEQHEVLEHLLEMGVPWDGNRAVDNRTHQGPEEAGNVLRVVAHNLETECQAVDIGAVVRNYAER